MACQAWHGIRYGLAIFGMVYDIAWRVWHGIWYVQENYGMVHCIPGGHDMIYDKAWRGMTWYVEMLM